MTSWIVRKEKVTEKERPKKAPNGLFITGIRSSMPAPKSYQPQGRKMTLPYWILTPWS